MTEGGACYPSRLTKTRSKLRGEWSRKIRWVHVALRRQWLDLFFWRDLIPPGFTLPIVPKGVFKKRKRRWTWTCVQTTKNGTLIKKQFVLIIERSLTHHVIAKTNIKERTHMLTTHSTWMNAHMYRQQTAGFNLQSTYFTWRYGLID